MYRRLYLQGLLDLRLFPLFLSCVFPDTSIGFLCFGLAPGPTTAVKQTERVSACHLFLIKHPLTIQQQRQQTTTTTTTKVKNDHRIKFSNFWKDEAWKNQGFNGIRTRDRCDALPTELYMTPHIASLNYKIYCDDHSSLSSTTAVQIWIISYILHIISLSFHWTKPVFAEVTGSNSVEAWSFSGFFFPIA